MCNVYPFIIEAQNHHRHLIRERRFFPEFFEGIPVFRINPNIRGLQAGNSSGNVNSRDYFYTVNNLPHTHIMSTNANRFRAQVHDPDQKKGICLHYTVGRIPSDLPTLTGEGDTLIAQYVSVPFLICHAGYIYQLSNPDTDLSWHLDSPIESGFWHNQIIGIELSNLGTDIRPSHIPENFHQRHLLDLQEQGLGLFRNERFFERFTDAQYNSLRLLIKAICRRYPQIRFEPLAEGVRLNFFGQHEHWGINDPNRLRRWRGISSHVNWSLTKWDIGPAFDWDRLMRTPDCRFPLETREETAPTLRWYANTELQGKGGFFPVGCNNMLHPGVHIFSDQNEAPVRSMADGYIVAFRFFTQERYNALTQNLRSIGLNHSRSTGFILIRHDIIKPVRRTMFSFRTGAPSFTRHTLYSLYVDLEIDFANRDDIPWAQRLREQRPQSLADGGIFNFDTFESGERVITFSNPLLPVKAGDIIWHTRRHGQQNQGNNHIHWEVFTQDNSLFQDITQQGGVQRRNIPINGEHGIFDVAELDRLFPRNWFKMVPFIGIQNNIKTSFTNFLRRHYANSDISYKGRIGGTIPRSVLSSEVAFRAFTERNSELRTRLAGNKIEILSTESRAWDSPLRVTLSCLRRGRYKLKMTLQALNSAYRLDVTRITPRPSEVFDIEQTIDHKNFFREFVNDRYMLRNALFSNISLWTEVYWRSMVGELQRLRLINRNYNFRSEDFIAHTLFEAEHPVYVPIFDGNNNAFINPANRLFYMHPATFMWAYSLNTEAEFIPPVTDNF